MEGLYRTFAMSNVQTKIGMPRDFGLVVKKYCVLRAHNTRAAVPHDRAVLK